MAIFFKPEEVRNVKSGKRREKIIRELNKEVKETIEDGAFLQSEYQEIEKTEKDKEIIKIFSHYIYKLMKSLGIEKDEEDVIDHIYFVLKPKKSDSIYNEHSKYIEISGKRKGIDRYVHLLHEMLHLFSSTKVFFFKEKKEKIRSGYSLENEFDYFNEAVTEEIMRKIFLENLEEISNIIKVERKKIIRFLKKDQPYSFYQKLLKKSIETVAQKNGERKEEIWNKIMRGYFSGEMMHLRKFEKTYGKGFLRFLAYIHIYINGAVSRKLALKYIRNPQQFKKFLNKIRSDTFIKIKGISK